MSRPAWALLLDEKALAQVAAWQHEAGSREVCGLCAVDSLGELHLLPLTNQAGLPSAFEISCSEEAVVRAAAAQLGWEIVAFLHTHPLHAPAMSHSDARAFERIVGTPTTSPQQRGYARPGAPLGSAGRAG
jgi:proteasome lid subunit RPN8/RPN11